MPCPRRVLWTSGLLALLLACAVATPASAQGSAEKVFQAGGRVRMDLSAGAYVIGPGRDDRIFVKWDTETAEERQSVKVDIQPQGNDATITVSGPRNHFRVVIELPARTDLRVSQTAGDLQIHGIVGNKDVDSWAGRIDIEVGRPEDYASVRASVTAGDLVATPFSRERGGLFRSVNWRGPGQYTLDVRLTAGDLRLR
jgi:hypothetical protein